MPVARASSRLVHARRDAGARTRDASRRVRRTRRATPSRDEGSSIEELVDNPSRDASKDAVPSVNSAVGDVISSPLFYVTFGVAGGVGLVRALGENASFLLSAAPIVALTAISKTDFGAELMARIDRERPALDAEKARKEMERAEARGRSAFYGANRVKFLGDLEYEYPAHLDGTLCGDVGFDPLNLAVKSEDLERYRELELLHGRWAMLGVVGAAVPETLDRFGVANLGEPVWWKVGAAKMNSDIALDYLGFSGFHIAGGSGIAVIAACQLVLMGGPEYARYVGINSLEPVGVYLPGDKDYPGGAPFDPFKFSDDAEEFEKQKVMEIKHCRLAMIAALGCAIQAIVTRQGPIENLASVFGVN
ncbi:chlorophyll a/b-binding protein domain-containing protein [Ostreococcus tauri]|uniref:Chlorophyll a-b binding protein, chloroplastic n=1 Tax=Ostreococcus tauri TaxID=70448 RepID=A0A1Y5I283_OSTTA|nr:chlorophyll a/b-binding protein domain-containing protein [Ostreococcus tauri]